MVDLSQSMSQSESSVSDLGLDPSILESMDLDVDFLTSGTDFAPPFSSSLDEESLVAGFSMAESVLQGVADDDKAISKCGEQSQLAGCDDPRQLGDDWPLGHLETDLRSQSRQETSLPTRFTGRVEQSVSHCITTNDCVYRQDHSYTAGEDAFSGDGSEGDSILVDLTSSLDRRDSTDARGLERPPSGLLSPISDLGNAESIAAVSVAISNPRRPGLRPRSSKRKRCFSNTSIASEESTDCDSLGNRPSSDPKRPARVGRPRKSSDSSSLCMSKNAIAARENREKKKAYVTLLENQLESLKKEVSALASKNERSEEESRRLCGEVAYLRSIISNIPQIRQLMPAIQSCSSLAPLHNETNLPPASSALRRSHSQHANSKKWPNNAGICLHLVDGHISLEFCSVCSVSSSSKRLKD